MRILEEPQRDEGVEELAALHNKIAGYFKEYEQTTVEHPPFEVPNELRYALRSIMELHICDDESRRAILIQQAKIAFYCAYHDLLDGVLIELSMYLNKSIGEYPDETLKVMGSKYIEIIKFVAEVEEKIKESRKDTKKRHEIYNEIYRDFEALIIHLKFFKQDCFLQIVKISEKLESKAKYNQRIGIAGIVVGIAGTFVCFLL